MNSIWIARDKDGSLFLYDRKPIGKNSTAWLMPPNCMNERIVEDWFPEITWERGPIELIPKISFDGKLVEDYIKDLKKQLDFTEVRKFTKAILDDKEIDSLTEEKED